MDKHAQLAVTRAHAALDRFWGECAPLWDEAKSSSDESSQDVEKTIWGSPAGKKRIADKLARLLPPHRVYVEPFAGSAAVLFEKAPSEVEVINDADPEIAQAFKIISALTPQKIERLKSMPWVGDKATFLRLYEAQPSGALEKLHRFLYVSNFSYGRMRGKSFNHSSQGVEASSIKRLEQHAPRLARVRAYSGDYEPVVRRYDGPDTVFFLDPPYPGYDAGVGESQFDEERFFELLKSIKGKWLMTYGIRGKLPGLLKGTRFHVQRIRTPRTIRNISGAGGPSMLTQLLVSNYPLKAQSRSTQGASRSQEASRSQAEKVQLSGAPFVVNGQLLKGTDPSDERYVLGVVLVPERVDAQGDIYSHDEVRRAAHKFMEAFGGLGLMHQMRVNDQVKVLESYLSASDQRFGELEIPKGTWMLAVRVQSDDLWARIKNGELTGFSIGGSARRVPEGTSEEHPQTEGSTTEGTHAKNAVQKAAPLASNAQSQASIHRLLDIVVEEVSLVDRAANEHTFLVVKRDTSMTVETESSDEDLSQIPEEQSISDDFSQSDQEESEPEHSAEGRSEHPMMMHAVQALEALTGAVELLGVSSTDDAQDAQLLALATELRAVADRLLSEQASSPVTDSTGPEHTERSSTFEAQLAAVRQALSQLSQSEMQPPPAPPPQPAQADQSAQLAQSIAAMGASLQTLMETVRAQQKRLVQVEKQFGLPNSAQSTERVRKAEPEEIGWPMDLNQPMDRESVDQAVSFHDL